MLLSATGENMKFFMHEHVKVEASENGTALITVRVPAYMATDIIELADHIIHCSRWLRTRSRAQEAVDAARKLRLLP